MSKQKKRAGGGKPTTIVIQHSDLERATKALKRQGRIPGTEQPRIPEIEKAAVAYVEARDAQKEAAESAKVTHEVLVAAMRTHDVTTYRDDDAVPPLIITLESTDKAKVVQATPPKTLAESFTEARDS